MFEYEGEQYSLEEIQQAAEENNVTLEEYISRLNIKKIDEEVKTTPQEAGAPVAEAVAPDMDFSLGDTFSESQEDKYAFEKPFQGTFLGDVVLDFFGDIGRSVEAGFEQAEMMDPALEIMKKGKDVSPEFVEKMIELSENPPEVSDEMREFQKIYEEEGGGTFAFLKGLVKTRGQVAPQIFLQSMSTMLASLGNKESLAAGAVGAGAGAVAGATAGAPGGPLAGLTALGGGVSGFVAGVSGTMESSLSFAELLQEELEKEGKDFTKENVNNLLQDEEKFKSIRNRAVGRGVTIGAVEGIGTALTGGAVKAISGTGRAARLAKVATSVVGESVAGGVGEAAGMAVAGQELNAMDIGMEAIGSIAGAPVSLALAAKGVKTAYMLNGENISRDKMEEFIDSDDGENIATSRIKIKGDQELFEKGLKKQEKAIQRKSAGKFITDKKDLDEYVELETERKKLQGSEEFIDKQRAKEVSARLTEIYNKYSDTTLKDITEEKVLLERQREVMKEVDIAKKYGEVKVFETEQEFYNEYKDLGERKAALDEIMIQDGKGKTQVAGFRAEDGTLVINLEGAAKVKNFSVASHELLHNILRSTFATPAKAQKIVNEFKSIIKGQKGYENIEKRLELYDVDDPKSLKNLEEVITLTNDAIRNNQIKIDDNIFDKIKRMFEKLFATFGLTQGEFKSGKDVVEFLKTYRSGFDKDGKISLRAQRLAKEGAKIKATEQFASIDSEMQELEQKFINQEISDDEYYSRMEKLEMMEELVEPVVKTTKNPSDFKQTLDTLGREFQPTRQIPQLAFHPDVRDTIRTIATIKSKQRGLTNLPGFDMEDFTSQVYENMVTGKKNKDGSIGPGYLQVFDPSVNDSFYGYINAQINNRMNSVLKQGQITREKFASDFEQQIGLSDSYDFTEAIDMQDIPQEDIDQGLINPIHLLDTEFQQESLNEVESKVKDVPLDNLIFKKTPNLVISTLAKQFGVRESVIQKASQNLNTTELEATAPVLAKMAKMLIRIMPQGAIVGSKSSVAVSEKLIGTGTGLPRKILEAYYEKGKRLLSAQEGVGKKGAGLEPFTLKQNITEKQFLEALGINEDGTHNADIKPKSPQSQTRRAMIDLYGKLISNTAIRQYMKDNGFSVLAVNDLAGGKSAEMLSIDTEKDVNPEDIVKEIPVQDLSQEFKEEFRRLHPHVDIDGDTEAIINQMVLNLLEEKSTTARLRQLFYNNPIVKDKIEKLGIDPQEVLDAHDATGQRRGFLTINGIKTTQKHAIQMSKFWPRFLGITPARIRGLWGLDERSFVYGDKKQNVIANDGFKNKKGELTIQILDGTVEEKLDAMMTGKEANSAIEDTESFKYTPKQKEYIKKINDFLSKNKIVVRYFYTNELSAHLNKIIKTDESFKNLTEEQKQEFIEKEIDKAKKYNSVKQDIIRLHLSMLSSYVREKGISKAERLERVVYAIRLLSNTSGGIKDLALIKAKGNIIGPSTFNKGVYKSGGRKGKPKTAVRIEHLISTGFQDVTHLIHVLTGDLPIHMYKAGIVDDDLSIAMDKKYMKVLMKDGASKLIPFQTGAIKARFEELVLRATESGLKRFSIDTEVAVDTKERVFDSKESFLDLSMGNIIKNLTGISVNERVSQSTAKIMAANRNKKWRLLSPSADDFVGLLYSTLGKGKIGDAQLKFYKKFLIDPFNRANHAMDAARQKISRDFKDLNKEYEVVKKSLGKKSGYKDYTNDQAIRVYLYKKAGASNSSLSINEADENALLAIVRSNPEFEAYANYLMEITELDNSWIEPSPNWVVGSIFDDVNSIIDRLKRAEYLSEWKENVDVIFSENNRNKLEGYFGEDYRKALDDMLYRMEKGKAIPEKMNKEMSRFQQWLTGSVAVTMFLNRRSAVLQTISNINYMNWSDNNPIAAAKAFANTPQFAKDFALIFNSDYLKQRRGGLKTEVEAAVLANELRKGGVEGMRGAINKLLKAGFTLTQLGDSFAISFGGASFYRNRKNSYLKQGLTEQEARDQAFLDFREISEESQQSARPDRLSMQQTNSIGRVFLAFQNTPMQYYRLIAKAIMDIKNGRGDLKTNISKIAYYGIAQNLMFTAMQQALFAFLFDSPEDEEEEETKDERVLRTINNSIDTIIRGTGYYGAVVSTVKNVILEFIKQEKKGFKADHAYTMVQALNLSAPIGIKARTLYQGAYQNYKYNKEIIDDLGYDIDNPGYDIAASLVSFGVNVPLDKVIQMTRGIKEASDKDNEAWQRIALALGWSTWNLGMPNEKIEKAKEINTKRKKAEALEKRKQKSNKRFDPISGSRRSSTSPF